MFDLSIAIFVKQPNSTRIVGQYVKLGTNKLKISFMTGKTCEKNSWNYNPSKYCTFIRNICNLWGEKGCLGFYYNRIVSLQAALGMQVMHELEMFGLSSLVLSFENSRRPVNFTEVFLQSHLVTKACLVWYRNLVRLPALWFNIFIFLRFTRLSEPHFTAVNKKMRKASFPTLHCSTPVKPLPLLSKNKWKMKNKAVFTRAA